MDPKNSQGFVRGILIFLIVMLFIFSSGVVTLLTDYLWFDSLGFSHIFLIELKAKIALFFGTAFLFFLILIVNLGISSKINSEKSFVPFKVKLLITIIISFFAGSAASGKWLTVLQYLNQAGFNVMDPVLMKDVSFYVFSLPFLMSLWTFLFVALIMTTIFVALDYFQSMLKDLFFPRYEPGSNTIPNYSFSFQSLKLKKKPGIHLTILASLIFLMLAARHYLERFSIMYSEKGIVVGAGYTDVTIALPVFKILMIMALAITVFFILWIFVSSKKPKLRKRHVLLYVVGLYLVFGFIAPTIIPDFFQALRVSPNEINLEEPYIMNNIEYTRKAYGLDNVTEREYEVKRDLSPEMLEEEADTVRNIRILDRRPLKQTYQQTQEIRLYYDLSNIDVDRYMLNGNYTSVLLSPRELEQRQLSEDAKTWVNLHLIYTHGYGLVMSPVNKVTKEGLPDYIIKDIPPTYTKEYENIKIEEPRIYYGENDNRYVIVNTDTEEFDYPKGNDNKYFNYDGSGGITLDSFGKKLLMALKFGDVKILLSSDITEESKIKYTRKILERVSKITPFFSYDSDPYVVIHEGRLKWIIDAYTTTNYYPYSKKYNNINYIRNPVKIVVDAYDGDVTYYAVEEDEPMMKTYSNIFPGTFRDFSEMPEGLKKHIRYPKDMFKVQTDIYKTYHMNNPRVFYNKEDAWETPNEIYGVGQEVKVEPYHVIMELPEEEEAEFILLTTFTPIQKNNMVSWMAARSDGEDYGKLIVYKFPKDKLIYGPSQVEARFDQDTEISEQLTLWSQSGSSITRGNLLVIPIKNNILYVEPLYIKAERGQLPELKRVLVSDGEQVVMENNLQIALKKLFGELAPEEVDEELERTSEELIKKAQEHYDTFMESMRDNDWENMGESFSDLGDVLEELQEENQIYLNNSTITS